MIYSDRKGLKSFYNLRSLSSLLDQSLDPMADLPLTLLSSLELLHLINTSSSQQSISLLISQANSQVDHKSVRATLP